MDSKHTPGPWDYRHSGYSVESDNWQIGLHNDEPLCIGLRGEEYMCVSGICTEADARLIASAPDLLDALKYARRFLKPQDHDTAYVDGVIAKATGQ